MEHLDLAPSTATAGTVRLPGSKSISNRTLLLAALSEGSTEVRGLLDSDDTRRMLEALTSLGVQWAQTGERAYRVEGVVCRDFLASHVVDSEEIWMQGEACKEGKGQDKGKWAIRKLKPWRRT